MARRSTDLLEVFRGPREGGGTRSGKTRSSGSRRKGRGGGRRASTFEGLVLGPRQVLLASCVLVLLLVLAFTVGLGVGRRGGPRAGGEALSRDAARDAAAVWYIRGRVPRRDVLRGAEVDPDRLEDELVREHGFRPTDLRVTEGEGAYFFVHYGPFTSKEQARQVLRDSKLAYLNVRGSYPFVLEEVVRVER